MAKSRRNHVSVAASLLLAAITGFGAYVAWSNLQHDSFMWVAAVSLSIMSGLFLITAISGKAEDLMLALVAWW